MPFDGNAQWQIDILAADKTAAAFSAVDKRLQSLQAGQSKMAGATSASSAATTELIGNLKKMAAAYLSIETAQKLIDTGLKSGELGNQASQLGVTTDQLQAYRLMAAQAGASTEQLDAALIHLASAAGTAKAGNDDMIARFDKLGVKLLDAHKNLRPVADLLPEVSRGLLGVSSSTERTALMTELFGKSGARMQTMLAGWAEGNDKLVASARGQDALASPEAIKKWDELGNRLKANQVQYEALVAEVGKPVAAAGLWALDYTARTTLFTITSLGAAWKATKGLFDAPIEDQLKGVQADIEAFRQRGYTDEDAALKELIAKRNALLARTTPPEVILPPIVVTASTGVSQPTGKTAGALGDKLGERLAALQAEHKALDEALAMFRVQGTESVEEVDRRLNAQVALTRKLAEVLKEVPKDSPLRAQLVAEATAINTGQQRLEDRKRLLGEAERVTAQFGDGTAVSARQIERLNLMLADGAIQQGTYERAVKATKQAQDDQARAARGAGGGFDSLVAGLEQGMADLSRANTLFEVGKRGIADLASEITNLGSSSGVDFGKVALNFARMLLQMEIAAQASNIFNMLSGKGATNQGVFGSLLGGLFGSGGGSNAGGFATVGSGAGSTNGMPNFNGLAGGGDTPLDEPFWVGEDGPELMKLGRPGHVYNRDQMGDGGGGGSNVYVSVFNSAQANVTTRKRRGPGGQPQLDVLIEPLEAALASRMDRGQGAIGKVLGGRFGLVPR